MSSRAWALAAAVLAAAGLLLGGWLLLLAAVNPVADGWVCSEGQAPAIHRAGGSDCFGEGRELPRGWTWDPRGNRPLGSAG